MWRYWLFGAALCACNLPEDPYGLFGPPTPESLGRTARPPTALSGGTLALADPFLVVADTDRDRIVLVHTLRKVVTDEIPNVSEPGRILVADDGQVHVALRGSGELLSFRPREPEKAMKTKVCGAPRGLAEVDEKVWVACASGALHVVDPQTGHSTLLATPASDLRDLVVFRDRVFASRFQSAEVLELDRHGRIVQVIRPLAPTDAQAAVAWRLVVTGDRRLALLHQIAHPRRPAAAPVYYSPVGPCGSMVTSALTVFDPDAATAPQVMQLDQTPLALDVVVDSDGQAALAAAGVRGASSARLMATEDPSDCKAPDAAGVGADARYVAVARFGKHLAFQSLDPPRIDGRSDDGEAWSVALPGPASDDRGHALFHDATAAGLACASCHPEGGDDGVVWLLDGPRRTQYLAGGLDAPFHWKGDLVDIKALLSDVLTRRMFGPTLDDPAMQAFGRWLDALPQPLPDAPADLEAVARGEALFHGAAACGTCHVGGGGVDGLAHDVGTGEALQTPSLRNLAARTSLMHTGCAATLAERFDPACGGDRHGNTADLSPTGRADLIAYLNTL